MNQIGFGPLYRVDGPLPLPPRYGLLQAMAAPAAGVRLVIDRGDYDVEGVDISSTGQSIDEVLAGLREAGSIPEMAGDLRWINGVTVYPYPPGQAKSYNACGSGTDTGPKDFGADLANPEFNAITIYLAETCKTKATPNQQEFRARATTALTAVQGSAIERNFLTGEASDPLSPFLADGNGTFPTGDTPTSAINALAILEEYIGLSGQLGIIHCSPGFATALLGRGFAIDDKTGVIRTINGNVVIPGAGYARDVENDPGWGSPEGHASSGPTQEWMYATGPIDIRLSEMFVIPEDVEQAIDRGTPDGATSGRPNTITYRAERYAVATWDTALQVGVLADKCMTTC
jgi:hypothetical protein